jgi:hypothetical protein
MLHSPSVELDWATVGLKEKRIASNKTVKGRKLLWRSAEKCQKKPSLQVEFDRKKAKNIVVW